MSEAQQNTPSYNSADAWQYALIQLPTSELTAKPGAVLKNDAPF